MKLNFTLLGLIVLTATGSVALAQNAATNSAAADATPAATTTTTTTTAVPPPAPDASANAASGHDASAVIPLIVMDEVPLTDAIKNLARQAGLNYMLDPHINYGMPDANGVVHPQPTVSLRWENLTADQALSAVLDSYSLMIVDDPKTHVASIKMKDPTAPDPLVTKIIQLKYASATNMANSANNILIDKRSKVIPDNRTSQLVVVATDKEIASIDELVARLDSPTKQVLIEAKLVETSSNPTTSKGLDWSGTLAAQHITFGNGSGYFTTPSAGAAAVPPSFSTVPLPANLGGGFTNVFNSGTPATAATPGLLNGIVGSPGILASTSGGANPSTFFLNADGVSAVLSFLNSEADTQVLSTPRAVTLDNEQCTLSVTTAEPIFNTTAGTQGSPGGSQVTYTNLGTILKVTPRISANDTIALTVTPEVSDIGGVITKTVAGLVNQADFFDIRTVTTRVLIPSGNTLVMGGLVSDDVSKNNTKVPILGDIPGLGWAFRSQSKTQNKTDLIIFITPTIVHDEDFQPTETAFLKTKAPKKETAVVFGAWDSAEPEDWSKLVHSKSATNGIVYPSDSPNAN
jgi:type II secretory pathway component GspD/PulD (secretin)